MKEVKFVRKEVLVRRNTIADASCKIYDNKNNKLSMKKTNEIADDIIKMLFERN